MKLGLSEVKKPRRTFLLTSAILFAVVVVAWLVFMIFNKITPGHPQALSPAEVTITAIMSQLATTRSTEVAPGLIVFGRVEDHSGTGLKNVIIYRSYSSYPGQVIATTDTSGYYVSDFYGIPGDEMVTIWANKSGVVFEPGYCHWRHYYGYEQAQCNFTGK